MPCGRRPEEQGSGDENSDSEPTRAPSGTVATPLGDAEAAKSAQAPTAVAEDAATSASCPAPKPHAEAARRQSAARETSAIFGEVVGLLMRTSPYKELWLTDLEWLVVPALVSGQVSVATAQSSTNGATMTVGAVLWARVSDEVDKRLTAEPRDMVRLTPREWTSGDIIWIVASAGDGRVLGEMVKHLATKEWAGKDVRIIVRAKNGQPKVAHLATGSAKAA